jgi:peptidoglycan/xylan/chitin deacetylase (PgdA/CDA1 family)
MTQGKHPEAVPALKSALIVNRNEPYGILLLGTLYLHTGNPQKAANEFRRAQLVQPEEPLAAWGMALSALAEGNADLAPNNLRAGTIEVAPQMVEYLEVLFGEAKAVRQQTESVTPEETDLLRLQIAAFAALRGGDPERGTKLLQAFLSKPDMQGYNEERGVLLPFLSSLPVQGGATAPLKPLAFPPITPGPPLSGVAVLNAPKPLPEETAIVLFNVEGGDGYSATTNRPPFSTQWNTVRYPNGLYTVRVSVLDGNGTVLMRQERSVVVSNVNAPVPLLLTEKQREEMRQRIYTLLTPHPTRKAAHFALAEQAVKKGDSQTALSHIEAVVAIDPLYRNARESLKQYNRTVIGEREGIWCAMTQEKVVALTFDDGPHPERTPRLLDALQEVNAVGTFFVVGAQAERSPHLLQRMDAEKHEIANHSYSHQNLTFMDSYNIERELCRTSVLIREAIGKRPRFFRPPGGNNNSAVVDAAQLLGMAGAYWTVDGLKFETRPFTPQALTNYILKNVRPGAILLLHNAPDNTIAAIPQIVRGLRAKGYKMVTMSELVRRGKPGTAKDAKIAKPYSIKE